MNRKHIRQRGVSLAEVVVAAAIVAIVSLSLISAFILHLRAGLAVPERIQSTLLVEEGIEALKFLRDGSWDTNIAPLALDTTYYFYATSTTYEATTTEQVSLNKFYRTFVLSAVLRNSDGIIVDTGGTVDDGSRRIDVSVSWLTQNGTTTKTFTTYLTNLFLN